MVIITLVCSWRLVMLLAPLSHGQRALWFIHIMEEGQEVGGAYNINYLWETKGLSLGKFQNCLHTLTSRHPTLRSTFEQIDHTNYEKYKPITPEVKMGEPYQVIHDDLALDLEIHDISSADFKNITKIINPLQNTPFDLSTSPPIRWRIFRSKGTEKIAVFLQIHHLAGDACCFMLLLEEISSLLKGNSLGITPATNTDFIASQERYLNSSEGISSKEYWKDRLNGKLPSLNLPLDTPRRPRVRPYGDFYKFELEASTMEKLSSLAKVNNMSPFSIFLSIYQIFLYKYTYQKDLLIGVPTAGRTAEFMSLFHYCVNPIINRSKINPKESFLTHFVRNGNIIQNDLEHAFTPLSSLVDSLQIEKDLSKAPIFQTQFVWENLNRFFHRKDPMITLNNDGEEEFAIGNTTWKRIHLKVNPDFFDITFKIIKNASRYHCVIEYHTDIFAKETITRMASNFLHLLNTLAEDPNKLIFSTSILCNDQTNQLIHTWNDTDRDYPRGRLIHHLILDAAKENPDNIAISFKDEQISYHKLLKASTRLSNYLLKMNLKTEDLVGIYLDRTPDLVISILAVFQAGGAYVSLDPKYPKDRIDYIIKDTQTRFLITNNTLQEIEVPNTVKKINIKSLDISHETTEISTYPPNSQNLAYIIYTSGSTGKPKGVSITHENAVCMISWALQNFTDDELEKVLFSTSTNFDLSIFEMFVPMARGCQITILENALELVTNIPDNLSLINTVPSIMNELLNLELNLEGIGTINLAGEPLPMALLDNLYNIPGVTRVYNLYGPSEDTTYSTYALTEKEKPITIGRPISNTKAYVLDPGGQLVPIGVPGELFLSGLGITRGYFARPGLTAEKYIPNPFATSKGERMYATGDLVQYRSDGHLLYKGRLDHQVKIRGFRIELGEIETAIAQSPGIEECVVMARSVHADNLALVAYFTTTSGELPQEVIIQNIKEKLPDYMIPRYFIQLESFPLTPNGKVDRKALPAPDPERRTAAAKALAPETPVEEGLVSIWSQILGKQEVGTNQTFFNLGGHSLLVARVLIRIEEEFKIVLTHTEFFQNPTIRDLASVIEEYHWSAENEQADDYDDAEEFDL